MLVQEFIDRTDYIPSEEGWQTINQIYSDSILDKDAFCKVWSEMHKEEIAIQKFSRRVDRISIELSHLCTKTPCLNKSGVINYIKDMFTPKQLRRISELCNALASGLHGKEGYIQIINGEIVTHFDYIHAAKDWYDNAQQSPMFKVDMIESNKFWFSLVKNIPMYDCYAIAHKSYK